MSMNIEEAEKYLKDKGVKPTANRILVLRALGESHHPLSLSDLEQKLDTLDKSSIFRVLTLFLEHDITHSFEDGRGVLNYELCAEHGECTKKDAHIHFYCESCCKSFCMDNVAITDLDLPEGFTAHSISFVVKGECPHCRARHGF